MLTVEETLEVTVCDVRNLRWANRTSEMGGINRFFNPGLAAPTSMKREVVVGPRKPESEADTRTGAGEHVFDVTQPGLNHGACGRFYIGVERWLKINGRATCCRLWSVQTALVFRALRCCLCC